MDPDVCRNCGHSGKHIDFRDFRCAITERDDAERDKLQADAALERARQLCESSLSLMKRQMQELEDANATIEALSRALAAAEDRRERVRRDLGVHGDVCLTARSNLEAAEEMAISAAGRYFEAGRAVTALEDREQRRSPGRARVDGALLPLPPRAGEEMDDGAGEDDEAREREDRKWQRSNERFCKWLRRSEAQRQIMKSSWTKLRVAERLASEGVDDEELARRDRVQEWAAARRLTDQLPPEDDPTMETEYLESEPEQESTEPTEPTEQSADFAEPPAPPPPAPKPAPAPTQLPSPTKTAPSARRAAVLRTRAKTGREAATAQTTAPPTPARGRVLRTARRVESQTRSEPARPTATTTTTTTTTMTMKVKKGAKTTRAGAPSAAPSAKAATTVSSDGAGRPAARTRARTEKTPAPEAPVTAAAGRPQRATRRRSVRVQPYPQPSAQPRWK
ncbi:hypothetical protein LZ31DRAFT_300201 [Colletotrichum somersetense]|nr:hypothetical protein LZ31DRAFT_300201 [Colletotrichum somersetense]